MDLQDWFYFIGIVFMIIMMVSWVAIVWSILWAIDQAKKAKRDMDVRIMKLKMAPLSMVPILITSIRKIFR